RPVERRVGRRSRDETGREEDPGWAAPLGNCGGWSLVVGRWSGGGGFTGCRSAKAAGLRARTRTWRPPSGGPRRRNQRLGEPMSVLCSPSGKPYVHLGPEQHRPVVVGRGPFEQRPQVLFDLRVEYAAAVRDHLDRLVEIELIGRHEQRERLDAPR